MTCALESMKYRELAWDELGKARTNYTLARIYATLGKLQETRKYLQEAEERALLILSNLLLKNIYSLLGELAEEAGNYRTTAAYLHKQMSVQSNLTS